MRPVEAVQRFYILDRDDTLIDEKNRLIHPEFLLPFISTILTEPTFKWAIASRGASELQEDPFYKEIQKEGYTVHKPPVYVQFNGLNSLTKAAVDISGLNIEWGANGDSSSQQKAQLVFDMLCSAEWTLNQEVKRKGISISFQLTENLCLHFKFGKTTIIFNAHALLEQLEMIAKGDCKLFYIFQALDEAQLRVENSEELDRFGVREIIAPEEYTLISPKDVVFVDDKETNCDVISQAGFASIVADTAGEGEYMQSLVNSLPEQAQEKFFNAVIKRETDNISDAQLKAYTSRKIIDLREYVLHVFDGCASAESLWTAFKSCDRQKLSQLFSYSRRWSSDKVPSEETLLWDKMVECYVALKEYHKPLSDLLIFELRKRWKSPGVQEQIARIAAIKPEGVQYISATHFRLAYEAQYQSEFFKNPRSAMRQRILSAGENFDNTDMGQLVAENKESSNRSSQVLRILGA